MRDRRNYRYINMFYNNMRYDGMKVQEGIYY